MTNEEYLASLERDREAALEEYLSTIPGKRAAELRRMFRESEAADREEPCD